jgi:hypothetical protein
MREFKTVKCKSRKYDIVCVKEGAVLRRASHETVRATTVLPSPTLTVPGRAAQRTRVSF